MPEVNAELGVMNLAGWRARLSDAPQSERGSVAVIGRKAWASDMADRGLVSVIGFLASARQWYAVYNEATGALWSIGTSLGDLPSGYASIELDEQPDFRLVMWDPVTLSFVQRPESDDGALPDLVLFDQNFPRSVSAEERVSIREILEGLVNGGF